MPQECKEAPQTFLDNTVPEVQIFSEQKSLLTTLPNTTLSREVSNALHKFARRADLLAVVDAGCEENICISPREARSLLKKQRPRPTDTSK